MPQSEGNEAASWWVFDAVGNVSWRLLRLKVAAGRLVDGVPRCLWLLLALVAVGWLTVLVSQSVATTRFGDAVGGVMPQPA
jgi:hypothetical protein